MSGSIKVGIRHNPPVKRWFGALLATVLACIPLLLHRSSHQSLLADSDTKVLLETIRHRNAPLSWFTGDWPLQNHFYRPISTLSFELDNRLYGSNAAGYGLTNALLCVACVLLLFWFLRELTDNPILSGTASVLFAFQHVGLQDAFLIWINPLIALTIIVGLIRHRSKVRNWLPACLVLTYCAVEIGVVEITAYGSLGAGTIGWLPGRTATVMTVFALAAMASYARYERLSAERTLLEPSPLDPPATKSRKETKSASRLTWGWVVFSVICLACALGSYEQAVMLPAALLAVAVTMRSNRFKVRWLWQVAFWSLLVGYLVLRKAIIPAGASSYQLQQFRNGPGVRLALFSYSLPFLNGINGFLANADSGMLMLVTTGPYLFFLAAASNLTAFYQARRRWVFALAGYGISIITFLPMAWVKPFAHYHYWPLAMRSLFTGTLLWVAAELLVTAWSPQSFRAPQRLSPAPGSLPRP